MLPDSFLSKQSDPNSVAFHATASPESTEGPEPQSDDRSSVPTNPELQMISCWPSDDHLIFRFFDIISSYV